MVPIIPDNIKIRRQLSSPLEVTLTWQQSEQSAKMAVDTDEKRSYAVKMSPPIGNRLSRNFYMAPKISPSLTT